MDRKNKTSRGDHGCRCCPLQQPPVFDSYDDVGDVLPGLDDARCLRGDVLGDEGGTPGTQLQILVGKPEQYVSLVNVPLTFSIKTPVGVAQEREMTDDGFNGSGETVTCTTGPGTLGLDGSLNTDIRVHVSINESSPAPAWPAA